MAKQSTLSLKEAQALQAKVEALTLQLQDRQRLLEYVATLLVQIDQRIVNTPALANAPKKFNIFYLLSNWKDIFSFIEFLVKIVLDFKKNIKIEKNTTDGAA